MAPFNLNYTISRTVRVSVKFPDEAAQIATIKAFMDSELKEFIAESWDEYLKDYLEEEGIEIGHIEVSVK